MKIEKLYTVDEVAGLLGVSKGHLAKWRCYKQGPAFLKMANGYAGAVRYRESDLMRWIDENIRQTGQGAV